MKLPSLEDPFCDSNAVESDEKSNRSSGRIQRLQDKKAIRKTKNYSYPHVREPQ